MIPEIPVPMINEWVVYVSPELGGDVNRTAVVVFVHTGGNSATVRLLVFGQWGIEVHDNVEHDHDYAPGTWHWEYEQPILEKAE